MKERSKKLRTRRKLYLVVCRLAQIMLFYMVFMGLILFASESPTTTQVLAHAIEGSAMMLVGGYGIAFVDSKM